MRLYEIYPKLPRRGFDDVYEVEEVYPMYDHIYNYPPNETDPQAWMPDMEEQPPYTVRFHYEFEPAQRGSRERGSGIQLEPDYSAGATITDAEVYDPRVKKWIGVDPELYFGRDTIEKVEDKIIDSLGHDEPDPYDYRDDY